MGDVTGDLSSRRGQITGTRAMGPGVLVVDGQAPLGELEGYSARLKAMTQGRGAWTMNLSHYEQAPPLLAAEARDGIREQAHAGRRRVARRAPVTVSRR